MSVPKYEDDYLRKLLTARVQEYKDLPVLKQVVADWKRKDQRRDA